MSKYKFPVVLVLLLILPGCITLSSSVPFKYVHSLPSDDSIDLSVGMEKLTDERPKGDVKATESILDVNDKVTAKILEDFRSTELFKKVNYPARKDTDDIIIKGQIKRFYWKCDMSPVMFIPLVNLSLYFGAPAYYVKGITQINLQLVDAKTGKIVAEYDKNSTRKDEYTIYNMKAGEAGAEISESFREVVKQIKDSIFADVKSGQIPVPK